MPAEDEQSRTCSGNIRNPCWPCAEPDTNTAANTATVAPPRNADRPCIGETAPQSHLPEYELEVWRGAGTKPRRTSSFAAPLSIGAISQPISWQLPSRGPGCHLLRSLRHLRR